MDSHSPSCRSDQSLMRPPTAQISPGDLICDIETDKATIGWEAQEDGYVAAILVPEGTQDVPVGKAVLVIADRCARVKVQ